MNSSIKGAAKSKTVWFNVLSGIIIASLPEMLASMPSLKDYIPAEAYRWLFLVVVGGNIVLRAYTTQALKDKA